MHICAEVRFAASAASKHCAPRAWCPVLPREGSFVYTVSTLPEQASEQVVLAGYMPKVLNTGVKGNRPLKRAKRVASIDKFRSLTDPAPHNAGA
jgi:hypothetical protein